MFLARWRNSRTQAEQSLCLQIAQGEKEINWELSYNEDLMQSTSVSFEIRHQIFLKYLQKSCRQVFCWSQTTGEAWNAKEWCRKFRSSSPNCHEYWYSTSWEWNVFVDRRTVSTTKTLSSRKKELWKIRSTVASRSKDEKQSKNEN